MSSVSIETTASAHPGSFAADGSCYATLVEKTSWILCVGYVMITSSLTSHFYFYWLRKASKQFALFVQCRLRQSPMSPLYCVCASDPEKMTNPLLFLCFPGQPCLTERQSSKTPTCRRTCSRTPWSVPHRPWRSTTSRKISLHTSKR